MQPHRRLYLTWSIMLRANLTFASRCMGQDEQPPGGVGLPGGNQ